MRRASFRMMRGFYTKKGDRLRNIPALVWGEKEPGQAMVGTHRHTARFAQVAMEHPHAKRCLWEVLPLPPRNSCWIDKCEWKLSAGQRSIKNKKAVSWDLSKALPAIHTSRWNKINSNSVKIALEGQLFTTGSRNRTPSYGRLVAFSCR